MRLRSSAFALIGASLFAVAQPGEEPLNLTYNGQQVAKQFIATRDVGTMEFTYKRPIRPMQSIDGVPPTVTVILNITADNGSPPIEVVRASPPGDFGTMLNEVFSAGSDVVGKITISKPEDLAAHIFNGGDPNHLSASKFTLSVQSGGVVREIRAVRFALLNRQLGNGSSVTEEIKSRLFPPDSDRGIDRESETTVKVTRTGGPAVTVSEFQPASTSTGPASALNASPDNGLSTGAIAGIAIGAALGVLLLGTALVWLFVRRRRQNKAGLGYNGGSGRPGDLVAEKEANAIVAESPRSPYSEDGPHRDSTLVGGTSETAGDYQPYSDNPTATANASPPGIAAPVVRAASANSRSTADRSSAAFPSSSAPAPPPAIGEEGLPPRSDTGMSGRYAHLIEDNMTAEEIARLEEEERQLDVAIEQARGVTTK